MNSYRKLTSLFVLPLALFFLTGCGGDNPFFFQDDFSTVPEAFDPAGVTPDTSETGLIVYTLETGSGEFQVRRRDNVLVFFTGRTKDGEVFDSSYKNASTSPSNLTVSSLVQGFQEGILGMKEGGKRIFIIPPELGYGGTGSALSEDTLVFDVEVDMIVNQ